MVRLRLHTEPLYQQQMLDYLRCVLLAALVERMVFRVKLVVSAHLSVFVRNEVVLVSA